MRQKTSIKNCQNQPCAVWIEPWPDSFHLQPGEKLTLDYECEDPSEEFIIEQTDECLVLWPNAVRKPNYWIDGRRADHRSWCS